ncbi:MAG: hypothetical protein ABW277_23045 [Longimicrobiaceae bacterium]
MRRTSIRRTILTALSVLAFGLSAGHASATYDPPPTIDQSPVGSGGDEQGPGPKGFDWYGPRKGMCTSLSCAPNQSCCMIGNA